jgi:hypothetical protein
VSEGAKLRLGKLLSCTAEIKNRGVSIRYQCHYRPLDPKNLSDFWWNDLGLSVSHETRPAKRSSRERAPQ